MGIYPGIGETRENYENNNLSSKIKSVCMQEKYGWLHWLDGNCRTGKIEESRNIWEGGGSHVFNLMCLINNNEPPI